MDSTIEIAVSADEILDRVDEMLSWIAIANEGTTSRYEQSHFMRAVPTVRLGNDICGMLTPRSVIADAETVSLDDMLGAQKDLSPEIGNLVSKMPKLACARIIETDPRADDDVGCPVIYQSFDSIGDDVSDLESSDNEFGTRAYKGVHYQLISIGDDPYGKIIARQHHLPQVARVLRIQNVMAFRDGRTVMHTGWFAGWNQRFFDLAKRPLGRQIQGGGGEFSQEMNELLGAVAEEIRRETVWTVELALARRRTGIGLYTDALGAREFVNMLRAHDSASGRRKSIVHWVSEHMRRKNRLDPTETVKVAAHLRGMSGLDAGRYHCRIWPATLDLQRAKNGVRYGLKKHSLELR